MAVDSHEISCLICLKELRKKSQNLSSPAVVIGTLGVYSPTLLFCILHKLQSIR